MSVSVTFSLDRRWPERERARGEANLKLPCSLIVSTTHWKQHRTAHLTPLSNCLSSSLSPLFQPQQDIDLELQFSTSGTNGGGGSHSSSNSSASSNSSSTSSTSSTSASPHSLLFGGNQVSSSSSSSSPPSSKQLSSSSLLGGHHHQHKSAANLQLQLSGTGSTKLSTANSATVAAVQNSTLAALLNNPCLPPTPPSSQCGSDSETQR